VVDSGGLRDVGSIVLPRWGAVVTAPEVCWTVVGDDESRVDPVYRFMVELTATGCAPSTRRSYCYDLLRWWRFCIAVDVPWDFAGRGEVRDLIRMMKMAKNPQRKRSGAWTSRPAAGSVNPVTGKAYLQHGYAPRTMNHALSVLSEFYSFAYENAMGPMWNPVPAGSGAREGETPGWPVRGRYRQRTPQLQPRSVSEELLQRLFELLGNDRDRALLAVALSSGARASELLSMTVGGLEPGQGVLSVEPKGGLGTRIWIPAAPESFVWIARYLAVRPGAVNPDAALWLGLRRPWRPLSYFGLRQVLERANAKLGANMAWHDFRHTFSHRILADDSMTLTDAQALMRHKSLTSVQIYSTARLDELVSTFHRHLSKPPPEPPRPGVGFDADDLQVLFPGLSL